MLQLVFARNQSGSEPVRKWLEELPTEERSKIEQDIFKVQQRWPVGRPLVGYFKNESLWEVRTHLKNRTARVIFFIDDNTMILLHGFIKKDQKTSQEDKELALKRKAVFRRENKR